MNAEQRQRLLDVARACREAPEPGKFDMRSFVHGCGTPACAAGHYAARPDLHGGCLSFDKCHGIVDLDGSSFFAAAPDYFGISADEATELFDSGGCTGLDQDDWSELGDDDRPKVTNVEAAEYFEAFVARKEAEASR